MVAKEFKILHGRLLEEKPEGASHDEASCQFCAMEDNDLEGGVMEGFTQEDLDAAVAAAVKPLEDQITQMSASQEEVAIQNRIDEATTPLKEQVTQLQADLDVAVLEASTSKDALTNTVAYLEQVETETAAEAAKSALRDERIAKVKEITSFPEDHIAKSAERWAAMSDEDFEAQVESWQLIASKEVEVKPPVEAPETVMTASADDQDKSGGRDKLKAFHDKVLTSFDPRQI